MIVIALALNLGKSPASIVFEASSAAYARMFPPVAASAMKKYVTVPQEAVASGKLITVPFFLVAVVPLAAGKFVVLFVTATRAYEPPDGSVTVEPVVESVIAAFASPK